MKKSLLFAIVVFMHELTIGQTLVKLSDDFSIPNNSSISPRRIIKEIEGGIKVSYEFDFVEKIADDTFSNASIIRIADFGFYGEMEAPALPLRIDRFSFSGHECKVNIIDSAYIELPMEISPVRPPMENGISKGPKNLFIKPIKPYIGFFPKSAISYTINAYRTQYIVDIHVMPVQYDYQRKKVRIFTRLSYLVENGQHDFGQQSHAYLKNDDIFLSNVVLNPSKMSSNMKTISSEIEIPGFLIISTPLFSNAVTKLAEWKRTIGFNVKVVMKNTWTEAEVRNAIASANINDSLHYLLIVGDYEQVPGKMVSDSIYTSDGWKHYTYTTDYYYGCLQQNIYPTIRRGRLSVSSSNEAMTVVDKILQYEQAPITQQSFYDTGLNCAYFQDDDRNCYEDVRFTLTSENIRDYLVNEKGKNINRVYTTEDNVYPNFWNNTYYGFDNQLAFIPAELWRLYGFQWDGDAADIQNSINDGVFYVLHRDHGQIGGWWKPAFSIIDVNELTNGKKLPIVFSMNCRTGRYNGVTCFAEAFLRNGNGGCVAIYAASETSFSGYNDALTIGMFDAIWPSSGFFKSFPFSNTISLSSTPAYKLGDILDIGLSQISTIYDYGNNSIVLKHTKEIFHCFGDPSMEIYTEKPTIFSNVSYSVENNVINVFVPESGKITFYAPITGDIASFEGACIQYPYSSDLRISITKHNKIPLIIEAGTLCLQNTTIGDNVSYESDTIKVGENVTTIKPKGEVRISRGTTSLKGKTIELSSGTTVELGAQLKINE